MTRRDWVSVGVRTDIVKAIDMFLKTSEAKNMSLKSRQEFLNLLAREYLEKYQKVHSKQVIKKFDPTLFDIVDTADKLDS